MNGDAGDAQDGPDEDPQPAGTLMFDLVDQRDADAVGELTDRYAPYEHHDSDDRQGRADQGRGSHDDVARRVERHCRECAQESSQ